MIGPARDGRALRVGQLGTVVVGRVRRGRWREITSPPPTPSIASARPPAAPMPASPQSNPVCGAWTRTTACGALASFAAVAAISNAVASWPSL